MAAPALADARDGDGLTPLHLAVVHGNVPLVQTLLAAGADVNARDDEHHTVVHWATGESVVAKQSACKICKEETTQIVINGISNGLLIEDFSSKRIPNLLQVRGGRTSSMT